VHHGRGTERQRPTDGRDIPLNLPVDVRGSTNRHDVALDSFVCGDRHGRAVDAEGAVDDLNQTNLGGGIPGD